VPAKFAWHEKWQIICLDLNGKDRLSYEDTTEKKTCGESFVQFNSKRNENKKGLLKNLNVSLKVAHKNV
jgi:hypothetical protein